MKILWAKSDFLHPTTRGGHIRTLEMLRRLKTNNEIHYVAFAGEHEREALARSSEYCQRAYPVRRRIPKRGSPAFYWQAAAATLSSLPIAVSRYRSPAMQAIIDRLIEQESFDSIVCDFIMPAPNFRDVSKCILFQHNVETMIWRRHAETSGNALTRWYFRTQAERMFAYERQISRAARHVIAVSRVDADLMRSMFELENVSAIPTGVDVEYFTPTAQPRETSGLVFVGAMDWLPNIDAMTYFVGEVLPRIRRALPDCWLTIAGRTPPREIVALGAGDPLIRVTGTVPDIRPYLWGAAASIVPLRIGGGTRMKIYESMAARVPVVSTTIGAEGLVVHPGDDIRIADTAESFAAECVELLRSSEACRRQAESAFRLVASQFGWDSVARQFESILERHALGARAAL